MSISSILPSMFLRRLVLLISLGAVAMMVLGVQMVRLTVTQGEAFRTSAESYLITQRWIPSQRGQIKDRKGRILAKDAPSFDIAFDYNVIVTGLESHSVDALVRGEISPISQTWAEKSALAYAEKRDRSRWADLNDKERAALVDQYLHVFQAHAEAMWDGLARATNTSRADIDFRRKAIKETVEASLKHYVRTRTAKKIDQREREGHIQSEEQRASIAKSFRDKGIREQGSSHIILARVGSQTGFQFLGFQEKKEKLVFPDKSTVRGLDETLRFPGLDVRYSGERDNPYERMEATIDLRTLPLPLRSEGFKTITVDGVACHIIGRMRNRFYDLDVNRRAEMIKEDPQFKERVTLQLPGEKPTDLGRYFPGDWVGTGGVEASQEAQLRGLRGRTRTHMDTHADTTIGAVHGRDVQLTLDIELQARIQAAMSPELGLAKVQEWHGKRDDNAAPGFKHEVGDPLYGAAVVLDIESGEILAMVSTPTFTRQEIRERGGELEKDVMGTPLVNRAIAKPYAPGSIVKALMLSSATTRGLRAVGQTISCTGHLLPGNPNVLRCWIFKRNPGLTHDMILEHEPDGVEAIMVSCNIFFYTIGQRLGGEGVRDTFRQFGLGRPIDIGLGENAVYQGPRGFRDDTLRIYKEGEAIQMAIGQGPVDWTPLHAADAYATLARGGLRIDPTLVRSRYTPQQLDIGLSKEAVAETLEGLARSINDYNGTGNHLYYTDLRISEPHFNVIERGVQVWGKTGTADGAPVKIKSDKDGGDRIIVRDGDHSWFLVLVGTKGEKPKYSIAVVMDYAGSGGKVSGPIVNQIIHAMCDLGYLGAI
jgi:penicillin-binding protein 2